MRFAADPRDGGFEFTNPVELVQLFRAAQRHQRLLLVSWEKLADENAEICFQYAADQCETSLGPIRFTALLLQQGLVCRLTLQSAVSCVFAVRKVWLATVADDALPFQHMLRLAFGGLCVPR